MTTFIYFIFYRDNYHK